MSSSSAVQLLNTEVSKQNSLLVEVTKEGKLMLGGKEIRVKYGDETLTDHFELSKLASLLNKHYDTKKVFDALFNQAGSRLSLTANGLADTKDESKKIAADTKGFKGTESAGKHHARKFSEIEQDIKQSLAFSKEIHSLSQEYKDDTFKQSINSLLRDPGVDIEQALTGSFQWDDKSIAATLHTKANSGILRALHRALKVAPKQAPKQDAAECLEKLLLLLKKHNIALATPFKSQTIETAIHDPQALIDAKTKVSALLTSLKVSDIDSQLNVTSPISQLKLEDDRRLQHIRDEVAKLEKGNPRQKSARISKNLQLYAYKRLIALWETHKGIGQQAEPETPKVSPARILRPRSPRGKI